MPLFVFLTNRCGTRNFGQASAPSIGETENLSLKPGFATHMIKEETAVIKNISIALTESNSS